MNKLKKISVLSLLLFHNIGVAGDDRFFIDTLGAAAVGLATVCAGVWWYALRVQAEQRQFELNQQAGTIIIAAESLLYSKGTYAKEALTLFQAGEIEAALEFCITKFDSSVIEMVHRDMQDLLQMKKSLNVPGFKNKPGVVQMHTRVTSELEVVKDLFTLLEMHEAFFLGKKMVADYATLPQDGLGLDDWIYSNSSTKLYPLLDFKDKIDKDLQDIEKIDLTLYPNMAPRLLDRQSAIKKSIVVLYRAGKIQVEAQRKHENEIQERNAKTAEEKKQTERIAVDTEKRKVDALEQSAKNALMANQLKQKEIAALSEQTRVNFLRMPIDQENNRLQREYNSKLDMHNNLIAEQNRSAAERNRLQERLVKAEEELAANKRKEVAELKEQNRLQREANQLEINRKARKDAASLPQPSAPSAPAESAPVHIPVAVAVDAQTAAAYTEAFVAHPSAGGFNPNYDPSR